MNSKINIRLDTVEEKVSESEHTEIETIHNEIEIK